MATKHTSAGQGWQAITQHPLFATVVPVWLAATFALSTLAIRGALIERIVLSTQLDLILPMATPPLGVTARMLLAVAFGLMGALIGWAAVRMLIPRNVFAQSGPRDTYAQTEWPQARREAAQDSAAMPRRRADAHPDFPARQPIQAHAELGEHGFDNNPAQPAPAREPAPQVIETTPEPGYAPPPPVAESWQVLHDVLPPPPPAEEPSWDWKPQVAAFTAPVETPPAPQEATRPVFEPVIKTAEPFRQFQIDPIQADPIKADPAQAVPEAQATVAPKPLAGFPSFTLDGPSAADHIASASLDSLSHVELLERLARALQRHQTAAKQGADVAAINVQGVKPAAPEQALAPAPDGTGDALRAALASLRDVK